MPDVLAPRPRLLPRGRVESEVPDHAQAFVEIFEHYLAEMGVVLDDLAPREVTVWDPSGRMDGHLRWSSRLDLTPARLVEFQADLVEESDASRVQRPVHAARAMPHDWIIDFFLRASTQPYRIVDAEGPPFG